MKRRGIITVLVSAAVATIGIGFGVSYAAYIAVQESINVNSTDNDISIADFAHAFGKNSGNGANANSSFLIENSIHLRNLSKLQNAGYFDGNNYYFKVSSSFIWDGAEDLAPIGNAAHPFTGVFDGNGMTISKVDVSGTVQYAGLFGCINGGTVKNVILSGPTITITQQNSTANYIGFFAGYLQSGTIQYCFVYGGTETFIYSAILAATGTYSTSCADYFVGTGSGTKTGLSFLSKVDETTYHPSGATWDSYTKCPSSASGVISGITTSFSYSYYKSSASDTTVTLRGS